jgi:hypothetical protein
MSVEGRIKKLRQDHQELERQITDLEAHPGVDPLEISDLKKRKLAIKEELQGLEQA